jgi:transposase InsO family protein
MSIAVSSFRYQARRSDERLRERLVELAREKPRYGYLRLQVLMERDGERVNHKRLYRVYREAGSVPAAEEAQALPAQRFAAQLGDCRQPGVGT